MRALCGSIITAGALIGLGLAAIGLGGRYQNLSSQALNEYIKWRQLDTPMMVVLTVLLASALVGMAVTFVGLAYHHERRHRERLRELGESRIHS